ncbi:hypothetical protein MHU86_15910 [Fragilaria crotonensis]|nr:hypothetical protein MHU86_15910 [Fragilaria crotonensis]
MSDKKDNSDKRNKPYVDITPKSFAAFMRQPISGLDIKKRANSVKRSDSFGNVSKNKKSRVDTPKTKTVGDTNVVPATPMELVQSATPSILRVTRKHAATTVQVTKPKGATKAPREMAKFPNPSQSDVLLYLCQDFGLQLNDSKNGDNVSTGVSCRWEGQEFPSIDALRTHLCRTGLVAPSKEWFHKNMQRADRLRYYGGGTELYVPETKKARMIADWIRLDIVPVAHRKFASLERLAKKEVQTVLRKVGVRATMGHFEMDGEELQWNEVERKLATFGLSQQLWEHPGATVTEKLSVLLYYVDYEVIVLQRELTYMPSMDAELPATARPRRRVVLQSQQAKAPAPPKSMNIEVNSNPPDKTVEEDIVLDQWKAPDERQVPDDFPFFSDNEEGEEDMPAAGLRRPLEPFPPKRKKMRRKSTFCRRKLEADEFVGRCLLTSPDFWDTLGQIRPKSSDFAWGKPIGYRRHMGRAYFDSFVLFGKRIQVGSFVKMDEQYYKIISTFQATRSFIGRWSTRTDELQNRGYAYVELAPIKRDTEGRYFLFRSNDWNPGHIEGIPTLYFTPTAIHASWNALLSHALASGSVQGFIDHSQPNSKLL